MDRHETAEEARTLVAGAKPSQPSSTPSRAAHACRRRRRRLIPPSAETRVPGDASTSASHSSA